MFIWLSILLIIVAGIICFVIGYITRNFEVNNLLEQNEHLWKTIIEKDKIIRELKIKNGELESGRKHKYIWKDEN